MTSQPAQYQYSEPEPLQFSRRVPLRFEDEEALVSAFREQIRNERELEDAKVKLAQQ